MHTINSVDTTCHTISQILHEGLCTEQVIYQSYSLYLTTQGDSLLMSLTADKSAETLSS